MTSSYFRRVALWLGMIVLLAYSTSLRGSFHFDDSHSIVDNAAVRSVLNIPSFWTDGRTSSFIPENRTYRPLVFTFFSVCWQIGGGKTWPFHVMKLWMHWMVTLALFLIWRRLWQEKKWFPVRSFEIRFPFFRRGWIITPTRAAFLLALLFAIHPATSECVDYIAATTSLQCAMFYVWAYYSYLLWRDSGRLRPFLFSLFLYFLSVASKEEGITLPAVVLLTELLLSRGAVASRVKSRFGAALKIAVPYVILGMVLGAWIMMMRPESGNESRGSATSWEYFMTQWESYLFYMRIWFWPWGFNADNVSVEFVKSIADPLAIQALIGNLLIVSVAWFNRKRSPALFFGLAWFYVTITPASSVVVLAEAVNEHRMYLSYVGFVGGTFTVLLAIANAVFSAESRNARLGWIYSCVVVGLLIGTQERNRVWANDENLWLDTVEKNPTSGRALNNLGLVYMARGEFQKADSNFEKCEQVWPTYGYCPLNRGIGFLAQAEYSERVGNTEEAAKEYGLAETSFLRAYALSPRNVHVNFYLAKFNEEKKNFAKAVEYYKAAIDLTGGKFLEAEKRLAGCLTKLERHSD